MDIDNTLVCELDDDNFQKLIKFSNALNLSIDDIVNKCIHWCYSSKYFWQMIKEGKI